MRKNMWFSYFCSKLIQKYYNYLKYFIKVGVDSRFNSIMLEKCVVSLKECLCLLEKILNPNAQDCSVIARNFSYARIALQFFRKRSLG